MSDVLLAASAVTRRFGGLTAVNGVSLALQRGQVHAVIGTNGAGKSTLINILSGELAPSSGQVMLGGRDITAWRQPDRARAGLGRSYQRSTIFPELSVFENCRLAAQARRQRFWHWWRSASECRHSAELARHALERTGLADDAAREAGLLPHGRKRQLEIAMCLAGEPQVLLLDEPLSNLDKKLRVQMRQDLLSLQRRLGITTIFVTHDQEEAMTTADRMAVLDHGVVQQIGAPSVLFDYPVNRFVANFVGTMNVLEGNVRERTSGSVVLAVEGVGDLHLPLAGEAPAASRLAASFRPHTVQIEMADGLGDARYVWLPGIVESSEFLGEFTRYQVQIGEQRLTADQSHLAGLSPFPVGAPVSVGLEPTQVRLLAA